MESARRRKERALADLREFELAEKRGQLGDLGVIANVLYAQHRQARDVIATAPSREAAAVAAELQLEPRVVLPALEGFVRRVLLGVPAACDVRQAFLDAMAQAAKGRKVA